MCRDSASPKKEACEPQLSAMFYKVEVNSVLEAEKENVIKINGSSVSAQSSKVLSDPLV